MNPSWWVNQKKVFWVAVSILLLLRIPLASWTVYLIPATSAWIEPVYEIGTYLLIGFLIWWERKNLSLYHFDFLAILIFIIFKPFSLLLIPLWGDHTNPLTFPQLLSLPVFVMACILLALLLFKKLNTGQPNQSSALWFLLGSLTGIALNIVYGIFMIRWLGYPIPPNPGTIAVLAPIYQLGYAAVAEEPVFRGFLWGGLRDFGKKEIWVLFIQAGLFTVAHIHLLDSAQPWLFFGITFTNAIILGIFVWRSRLLSSSMALHGFANGSVLAQYFVYTFLFR